MRFPLPSATRAKRRTRRRLHLPLPKNERVFVIPARRINVAHKLCNASVQRGSITAKENHLGSPEVRDRPENLPEHGSLVQSCAAARTFYSRHTISLAVCEIGNSCHQTRHPLRSADGPLRAAGLGFRGLGPALSQAERLFAPGSLYRPSAMLFLDLSRLTRCHRRVVHLCACPSFRFVQSALALSHSHALARPQILSRAQGKFSC